MMIERTLVFIKPDHVHASDYILRELDEMATRVDTLRIDDVSREAVMEHYSVHRDKPFFGMIVDSIAGKSIVLAIYRGDNVIAKMMWAAGPTDPSVAQEGQIRGKYSTDSMALASQENRTVKNVMHRSDSVPEAEREIGVWTSYVRKQQNR